MTRKILFRNAICALATLAVAACAVGPDFKRPAPPPVKQFTPDKLPASTTPSDVSGGEAQKLIEGRDIPGDWWTLFHSPALNALIVQALAASPDLKSAEAALRVAMENAKAQTGAYYPSLDAGFNASRNQNSGVLAPSLSNNILLYNLYQAQLSANWTPDIWGGNRRSVEALEAQAHAQRFQLESTYLALTANLVAAAVQEASLRAQTIAAEDIVKIET